MPTIFYLELDSETLRIIHLTLHFSDFDPNVCELVSTILLRQSGKVRKCNSSFKKNINKYQEKFSKFHKDANYPVRQITSKYNVFFWITSYLFIYLFIYFFQKALSLLIYTVAKVLGITASSL